MYFLAYMSTGALMTVIFVNFLTVKLLPHSKKIIKRISFIPLLVWFTSGVVFLSTPTGFLSNVKVNFLDDCDLGERVCEFIKTYSEKRGRDP